MVRVSIHQPVYFPWLGFFHKLMLSDIYVVLDDCQAIKQSWMNRVMIKQNLDKKWITVPILKKHRSKQLVKDMEINYNADWVKKHLSAVRMNYSKAMYFDEIYEILSLVLSKKYKYLIDLNVDGMSRLIKLLKINIKIVFSSDLDYVKAESTERLINIVKSVNGNIYISGQGGSSYLKPELFAANNIDLIYQNYRHYHYDQLGDEPFMDGLSIIDTYTNTGHKGVYDLIKKNEKENTRSYGNKVGI